MRQETQTAGLGIKKVVTLGITYRIQKKNHLGITYTSINKLYK